MICSRAASAAVIVIRPDLSAQWQSRGFYSPRARERGNALPTPLSCHPSFQFPSRVILCPSTTLPLVPPRRSTCSPATVFLANSSITSFAHEASTRTTMSTVILALEATSSFLRDNCRENGFSCHIDSLIIARCNTHT